MPRISTTTLVICLMLSVVGLASQFYIARVQTGLIAKTIEQARAQIKPPEDYISAAGRGVMTAIGKPFAIRYKDWQVLLPREDLAGWVEPYQHWYSGNTELRARKDIISDYVRVIAPSLNSSPVDATLGFVDGALIELVPSREGSEVLIDASADAIAGAIEDGRHESSLVFVSTPAAISLESAERIGIKELIGKGVTSFAGSPFERAHNIGVGAEKLQSVLLAPGASFSFNDTMGKNTASQGYLPSKVIKGGRYVIEYGGGLCQVSTTLFRAVMYAGFDILERHGHALPVTYYSPQGFDATIYPNVVDLRFRNNTLGYVLIQSIVKDKTIAFEVYGTNDGRKVSIIGPHTTTTKPNGSFGTVLTRTIVDTNGASKSEQFYSFYHSPVQEPELKNPLE